MKTIFAAFAGAFGAASVLGIAMARPQIETPTAKKAVLLKLEWIKANPKSSESLFIRVDNGQEAVVSRQMSGGARTIYATPRIGEGGTVTVKLSIRNEGTPQEMRTVVTVPAGETVVVGGADSKSGNDRKSEDLTFVTATF